MKIFDMGFWSGWRYQILTALEGWLVGKYAKTLISLFQMLVQIVPISEEDQKESLDNAQILKMFTPNLFN